jgi:membrane protein implicated in regulation of membrane protease activity
MSLLGALYATHPELIWLLVAAICLIAELFTGTGRLVWPAIAAAGVSLLDLAHIRMGWGAEFILWAVGSLGLGIGIGRLIAPRPPLPILDHASAKRKVATTALSDVPAADKPVKPEALAAPE